MKQFSVFYYDSITHRNEIQSIYAETLKEAVGKWVRLSKPTYTIHSIQQTSND